FKPALEQVVLVLAGYKVIQMVVRRGPLRLDHLPRRESRAAGMADLSRPDQIVERPQGFLDRRQRIRAMNEVKIDPVRLEPLQARLDSGQDVAARSALQRSGLVHGQSALGRQHDVLAPVAETLAEDSLALAAIAIAVD